jgi:hypothetical protein
MSLDEKLGQMTQAERGAVSTGQITQFRLGTGSGGDFVNINWFQFGR